MQGHEEIVGRFSRFLGVRDRQGGVALAWRSDPQLERHMRRLLEREGEATADYWARVFLKLVQGALAAASAGERRYARGHLIAYLQPLCYRVAQELNERHRRVEVLRRRYSVRDYFQVASEAASDPAKLFKNFSLEVPSTLSAYAIAALSGKVRDALLQKNKEIAWRSDGDWGLLRKASQKRLAAVLTAGGMPPGGVKRQLLTWQLFKELYVPTVADGSRQLAAPTPEELSQMARRFNQQRFELAEPGAAIAANEVLNRLQQLAQAVRDRSKIWLSYPDRSGNASEVEVDNRWDIVTAAGAASSANDPLTVLVDQDEQTAIQSALTDINAILTTAFAALPQQAQVLLRLWKPGLGLTQSEIGWVCDRKQYAISRQLTRHRQDLLGTFVQRIEADFNLTLDNERLALLKALMTECLGQHCQHFFHDWLKMIMQTLPVAARTTLNRYAHPWQAQASSADADLTTANFTAAKQCLQTAFADKIETKFKPPVRSLKAVNPSISSFIEHWLHEIMTLNEKETKA